VSLAAGVTNLTAKITLFALKIRGVKKDMNAIAQELASLNLCLNILEHDQRRRIVLPKDIRQHIPEVLKNCEMITKQMNELLLKLQSGKLGRCIQ
jgi:poly-beta-hydroxyalkanoate depolymerase